MPNPSSVMDRVVSVEDLNEKFKVLVYSQPGVGKTKFVCEAPNCLLIDTEHGAITLRNHPELAHVKILPVKSVKDLEDIFWALHDGSYPEYETVIIDTLSELQKRALTEHITRQTKRDKNRDPHVPLGTDYQKNTEQIRSLVMSYRDLDRNVIFTAHEMEEKDDSTGVIRIRPALTPKVNQTVYGLMDLIGYMTATMDREGNITRSLQIAPNRRVHAKTRLALPNIMNNPKFQTIIDAHAGKLQSLAKEK